MHPSYIGLLTKYDDPNLIFLFIRFKYLFSFWFISIVLPNTQLVFESNKLNAYIKLLTSLNHAGITNYNLVLSDSNNDKESLKEQVMIANKLINFSKS